MEEPILGLLMEIPKEATTATVQGVQMQMIDNATRQEMLRSDPGHTYSECILSNGLFITIIKDGQLRSLYKVKGSPTNEMIQTFGK